MQNPPRRHGGTEKNKNLPLIHTDDTDRKGKKLTADLHGYGKKLALGRGRNKCVAQDRIFLHFCTAFCYLKLLI